MLVLTFFLLDDCRQLEFQPSHAFDGKRLKNHVIHITDVTNSDFCEIACYIKSNCFSYNLKKVLKKNGNYKCELNNSTFEGQNNKLETNSNYLYRGVKVCLKDLNRCLKIKQAAKLPMLLNEEYVSSDGKKGILSKVGTAK